MPSLNRLRLAAFILVVTVVIAPASRPATAQVAPGEFVTGNAALAWEHWNNAMRAILDQDAGTAEFLFGELLRTDASPLRVALLAQRTQRTNTNAGGILLFEQDGAAESLGENGQRVYELLEAGKELYNQANDGFYFAVVGRFDIARANFRALVDSNPDPVALLEFADAVPQRRRVLVQLADHPLLGEVIADVTDLLQRGEELIKSDPVRIKQQIERLGGPPRGFENAVAALRDSGEYAIPFLIEALRDPGQNELTRPILRALPQIDRGAMNPLVMALQVPDQDVKLYAIQALGRIGYWQAVPYLLKLRDDPNASAAVSSACEEALAALAERGIRVEPGLTAAEAFYRLANAYYDDQSSLAADPTLAEANVWYWREGILQNVKVPTAIFNEVMCMRACEEALLLNEQLRPALALWIAANFRREAQLGRDQVDNTRPDGFSDGLYYAEAAGPDYCLMALDRAVRDGDPAVALGTIDALQRTAGTASITRGAGGRQPLAEALLFPNQMVRVRAALALARANPRVEFVGYQNLMPVLAETLLLSNGGANALVIDPDAESANTSAASLRLLGFEALTDSSLLSAIQKARNDLPGVDLILLASDVAEPTLDDALRMLRNEFRYASVPVIVVTKRGDFDRVERLTSTDPTVGMVVNAPPPERLERMLPALNQATGVQPITPELGISLASQATSVLQLLAISNNPLFRIMEVEDALLRAMDADDVLLRRSVADTLAFVSSVAAQRKLAQVALNDGEDAGMRIAAFAALADAARRNGNLLAGAVDGAELIRAIVDLAQNAADADLRAAAAGAMGALNLPGDPASDIIRNLHAG